MANKSKYKQLAKVKIAKTAKHKVAHSSNIGNKNKTNSSGFTVYILICLVIGVGVIISLSPDEVTTIFNGPDLEITHESGQPDFAHSLTIGDEILYELEMNGELSYIKIKITNIQGLDWEIYRINYNLYSGNSQETISSSPIESGTFDISGSASDFFAISTGGSEGAIDDPTQTSSLAKLLFSHPAIPENTMISGFQEDLEAMAVEQEKFQTTIITTGNTIQIKLEMNGIVYNNQKSTYSTSGILTKYQFKSSNPRTGENVEGEMNLLSS